MKRYMLFILILIPLLINANLSIAETKTFIKEYSYQASEADSKLTSRVIALEQAKRLLLEELGTYLVSHTEIVNFSLTKDQIQVFSAGIVKADILSEKWDGKTYYLKAKLSSDPDEVAKQIDIMRTDYQKTKELQEAKKKADNAIKEIENVKKELASSRGDKTTLHELYRRAIKDLNETDWVRRGFELIGQNKDYDAIEAFTNAIELNPENVVPYIQRGILYGMRSKNQESIDDLTIAISLKPDDVCKCYYLRGIAYSAMRKQKLSIDDFDKAIDLCPQNPSYYSSRGTSYSAIGKYDNAIKDLNKAIEINPGYAMGYYMRGGFYRYEMQDDKKALDDIKKAAKLGLAEAQNMLKNAGISWY